jgi:acylphosphatase
MKKVHIFVSGIVQGVFFRAHTRDEAIKLNLYGYVKNLPDGRVEIVATGEGNSINKLISWCHKGPSFAHVTKVTVTSEPYTNEFKDFQIR